MACRCGCGKPTTIAPRNRWGRGWIKGLPVPYLPGHTGRPKNSYDSSGGYRHAYAPQHPRGNHRGYVREHVLVAEQALGHLLPSGAVVHHVNGNKTDNRNANLVICQDEAYHQILHRRTRAFRASGHAEWLRCKFCGRYDVPVSMHVLIRNGGRHTWAWHRKCRNAVQRAQYAARHACA